METSSLETQSASQFGRARHSGVRKVAMKRCALCHGKLGLGARFRNIWNGRGGFMFDFARFVAKLFMRLSETTPPNIAGTPFLLAAIRGPEAIDVPRRKQSPMKFPETS